MPDAFERCQPSPAAGIKFYEKRNRALSPDMPGEGAVFLMISFSAEEGT